MRENIHPNYHEITMRCICGFEVKTRSTVSGDEMNTEICANCHPFYTGKQKLVDSAGRIERFRRKYGAKSAS